jgi:hypothetical protein
MQSFMHEFSLHDLHQMSAGWVAKYEIWSTISPPVRLFGTEIQLPTEEIMMQLQQSLLYGNTDEERQQGRWTSNRKTVESWKLQFPIAIARDNHRFMILQTIYYLDMTRACVDLQVESLQLPLDSIGGSQTKWASMESRMQKSLDQRSQYECKDTYFYWLSLSQDGSFLAFIESDRPNPVRLAILRLDMSEGRLASAVVAKRMEPYGIFEAVRNINAVLHQFLPLLAFTMGQTVSVWNFDVGKLNR